LIFSGIMGEIYVGGGLSPEAEKALGNASAEALNTNITSCGDYIRKIKSEKASKDQVLAEVKVLKLLKDMYKSKTGQEWKPSGGQEAAKPKAEAKKSEAKKQPVEKAEGNQ
jgi:hypothetical protein